MLHEFLTDGFLRIQYEPYFDDYRLLHTVNVDMYQGEPTYDDMVSIVYNSFLDCDNFNCEDYYPLCAVTIYNSLDETSNEYIIPYSLDKFFGGKWVYLKPLNEVRRV